MTKFNYKNSRTDKEYIEFENILEKEVKKIIKEYEKHIGSGDNEYLNLSIIKDEDGWFVNTNNNYFDAGKPNVSCMWRAK